MAATFPDRPLRGVEAWMGEAHYGVYDHGAHVFAWRPQGERPVIFMSEKATLGPGLAIRGGVPVCFPWFAAGPRGDHAPAHGFARLTAWRRAGVSDETDGGGPLVVDYDLDETMVGPQPLFPHPFRAQLRAAFARDYCQVDLVVTNTGPREFSYEAALHTYLAVGDARKICVEGLEGARFYDKAPASGEARERAQTGVLTLTAETDRIYHTTGETRVVDPTWGRTIRVTKGGSAQTVVWNPWAERAMKIADFGVAEWTGMLCVEAANIGADAPRVSPGASHRLWQRIALA